MLDIVGDIRKLRFEFGRRFQPAADITCETKNGLMTFSNKDRSIGRRLYSRRHWSWDMLQQCKRLLIRENLIDAQGNDLLINVGANIGCILIPLMRDGLFRQGIGFEPAPINANYLAKNVSQNGLAESVRTFQMGLSDQDRVAEFELSPRNTGDHRVRVAAAAAERPSAYNEATRQVISIQLGRLDDVIQEHEFELGSRSLLWVDIQGHEGHFLQGARKTLAQGVPVVTELWPYGIARSGMTPTDFCDLIRELFASVYFKRRGRWQKHSTDAFGQLYDRYDRGTSGTDIILVSR